MSFRRLAIVFGVIYGFFLGPMAGLGIYRSLDVIEHHADYRETVFAVTDSYCTGGEWFQTQGGAASSSPEYCFFTGTIDGTEEELTTSKGEFEAHPPGSTIPVWYAPERQRFGVNYQNIRVLWRSGDDLIASARLRIRGLVMMLLFPALFIILLDFAYRFAPRPPWRLSDPKILVLGGEPWAPGIGFGFSAMGLALLALNFGVGVPTVGGIVVGGALCAIGLPLSFRPVVEVDRGKGVLRRRRSLWPVSVGTGTVLLSEIVAVRAEAAVVAGKAAGRLELSTSSEPISVLTIPDPDRARAEVAAIAEHLVLPFVDKLALRKASSAERTAIKERLVRRLRLIATVVAAVGGVVFVVATVPSIREPVLLAVVGRDQPIAHPMLRVAAVEALARHDSEVAIRTLVFVANTADRYKPYEIEIARSAIEAAGAIAGEDFAAGASAGASTHSIAGPPNGSACRSTGTAGCSVGTRSCRAFATASTAWPRPIRTKPGVPGRGSAWAISADRAISW